MGFLRAWKRNLFVLFSCSLLAKKSHALLSRSCSFSQGGERFSSLADNSTNLKCYHFDGIGQTAVCKFWIYTMYAKTLTRLMHTHHLLDFPKSGPLTNKVEIHLCTLQGEQKIAGGLLQAKHFSIECSFKSHTLKQHPNQQKLSQVGSSISSNTKKIDQGLCSPLN